MKNNLGEKTIFIRRELELRLEEVISNYPGLSLNLIVNQALEEWLKGFRDNISKTESFIFDDQQGFGPRLLK